MRPKSSPAILSTGDAEMLREAALEYNGTPLQPFNAHRVYAAGAMGARFLKFTPADWRAFFTTGIYAEAALDCAIVTFLCMQPVATAMRALSNPQAVLAEAIEWADAEGLHNYGGENAMAAGQAFGAVISGIFENLATQEVRPEEVSLRAKGGKKKP